MALAVLVVRSSIRYADKLKFDGSLSLRAELTMGKNGKAETVKDTLR